MTSGAFRLLPKTLAKKLRIGNHVGFMDRPRWSGSLTNSTAASVPSFKLGQQRGRGLGVHDSLGFMLLLCCSHAVWPWASHLASLSLRMGIKQSVPFHWDAVEAKSSDFGWCSMNTVSPWLLLKISPIFDPKTPHEYCPLFQFSRLSS